MRAGGHEGAPACRQAAQVRMSMNPDFREGICMTKRASLFGGRGPKLVENEEPAGAAPEPGEAAPAGERERPSRKYPVAKTREGQAGRNGLSRTRSIASAQADRLLTRRRPCRNSSSRGSMRCSRSGVSVASPEGAAAAPATLDHAQMGKAILAVGSSHPACPACRVRRPPGTRRDKRGYCL